MSRPSQRPWKARSSRKAGALLRFCAALVLVCQIVYAPYHLSLEPHTDEAMAKPSAAPMPAAQIAGDTDHHGNGHQEHSAAQHKFKALRSERAALVDVFLVPVVELADIKPACTRPQLFEFSGLSPPELSRSWQFFFRAALPVRAPSVIS